MSKAEQKAEDALIRRYLEDRAQEEHEKFQEAKNRQLSTSHAREVLFGQHFSKALKTFFTDFKAIPSKFALKPHREPKRRILNLMISDTHFGSRLDGLETPLRYGPLEESRRLAAVVQQVCDFKRDHRDETILYVHILGDIIQNQLHDPRDGAPLAEQAVVAMRLLGQALENFSANFPKVEVRCTPGNHGRNTARHKERAIDQKWDSIETIIYAGIRERLTSLPNVTIEIPKTPYYTFQAFDKTGFMTHGDTVIRPGSPGRSVNIKNVEDQLNRFNSRLESKDRYDLIGCGHVHIGSCTFLSNGEAFLTNGALMPPSPHSVSLGYLSNTCGQWMFESVPGYILGDQRFIHVGVANDKDSALDKIIQPVEF